MLISYIYDFLSLVFEDVNLKNIIHNVILFGSVARNEFDKYSDIDLFFDVKDISKEKEIESSLKTSLKSFETISLKKWRLKNVNYPINFIVGNLDNEKWSSLKADIISNGILLYGKYEKLPETIKHYALIYFSTKKMKKKDLMKLHRLLFGYKNIKNKKKYIHKGYIEKRSITKLNSNVLLCPLIELTELKKIFSKFKITINIIEIWTRD